MSKNQQDRRFFCLLNTTERKAIYRRTKTHFSIDFLTAIILLPFLVDSAFSVTYTQTEWSGRQGVYGPVSQWNDDFYLGNNIDCESQPGIVIFDPICYVESPISENTSAPKDLDSADMDLDGDMDVVSISWPGQIVWWENNLNTGSTWESHLVGGGLNGGNKVTCSDIDDDGDIDLLGVGYLSDTVCWFENVDGTGETWQFHLVSNELDGALDVQAVDLDQDNDIDILAVGLNDDVIMFYENWNSCDTVWIPHPVMNVWDPTCVCAVDMDSDGDIDVFGGHSMNDDIYLRENTPEGWVTHYLNTSVDNPKDLCSSDIDQDGDPDLICAASQDDNILWIENRWDQQASWLEHDIATGFNGAYSVGCFDMENDGDVDVIGTAAFDAKVCIWENLDGMGLAWDCELVTGVYQNPFSAIASNLTGDSDNEIVTLDMNMGLISWFQVGEFQIQGDLFSSVLYLGHDPDWGIFDSTVDVENGTSIEFQVRASDDPGTMGPWSDTLSTPFVMDSILEPDLSYLQYKVIFSIEPSSTVMPVLHEVTAQWDIVGLESEFLEIPSSAEAVILLENPVSNSVIRLHLAETMDLSLKIFDLAGREHISLPEGEYHVGEHTLQMNRLPAGVYWLIITSQGQSRNFKLVLL